MAMENIAHQEHSDMVELSHHRDGVTPNQDSSSRAFLTGDLAKANTAAGLEN